VKETVELWMYKWFCIHLSTSSPYRTTYCI